MASRSCRSLSFWPRVNESSLRSRLLCPSNAIGSAVAVPRLRDDFESFGEDNFFGADFFVTFLAEALRAGFDALRATGFFAAVFFAIGFFFFDLGIMEKAPRKGSGAKGGLIKNISPSKQAEI